MSNPTTPPRTPTTPRSVPAPAAKATAPAPSHATETTSAAVPSSPIEVGDASLVEVHKDGEILRVHPATVAAHVSVGWRVVIDE